MSRETELREAIAAGEQALNSLRLAQEKLNSAKNWSLLDLFGGGIITDIFKHSRVNDASDYIEAAKEDILIFQAELADVQVPVDVRMEIGSFLTFADFFFDGPIADYFVHDKINDAREQVCDAIEEITCILKNLQRLLRE